MLRNMHKISFLIHKLLQKMCGTYIQNKNLNVRPVRKPLGYFVPLD